MNFSRFLTPAAWAISLVVAFFVGGKINFSSDSTSTSSSEASSTHSSPRASRTNTHSSSSTRKKTSHLQSSPTSHRYQDLDIVSIANDDNPVARASALLELINSLGANDFQSVVEDFRALGITRDRMSEYGMLLHAWAKVDPYGALDYAQEHTGTQFARQTILASWANDDPESAITWAKDHHDGARANPWLVGVIRGIASTNPTRATEVMSTLPYSRERGSALQAIIPHIAKQGQDQAIAWLSTISDEQLHSGATAYLASNLAKSNPASTAEWVNTLSNAQEKSRAAGEVAQQWVDQDLPSALAWTDTLDGTSKIAAARQVVGPYAKENPSQASTWLSSMSSEPGYEDIVRNYIWNTARDHPEFSLSHIPEIQSDKSQRKYYERILRSWKRRDANAADAWMNNNQVSDELRARVDR